MSIKASDINAVIDMYNTNLGLGLSHAVANTKITASFYINIVNAVSTACTLQDKDVLLPDLNSIQYGQPIPQLNWGVPTTKAGTTVTYTKAGTYTLTATTHTIMFNLVTGGGGSGGGGSEYGFAGGGGGGGSGGQVRYFLLNCNPGDVVKMVVGAGAQQGPANGAGLAGGTTTIYLNGNQVLQVTGGQGGAVTTNTLDNMYTTAAGGAGGYPNGLTGQSGGYGHSDYSSVYGAAGAPGLLQNSKGGAGGKKAGGGDSYTGLSAGKAGFLSGAGGGGGGCRDRSGSIHYWAGGAGADACVSYTFPSQGATGGPPVQDVSGYNTQAAVTACLTGDATVGGGYADPTGGDPNGTAQAY